MLEVVPFLEEPPVDTTNIQQQNKGNTYEVRYLTYFFGKGITLIRKSLYIVLHELHFFQVFICLCCYHMCKVLQERYCV